VGGSGGKTEIVEEKLDQTLTRAFDTLIVDVA
jgi:hypothetical protein